MTTKNKKPEEPIEFNAWWCSTCSTGELTVESLREHLRVAHSLDLKGLKGQQELLVHLDSSKWFQSDYRVTIKDPDGKEVILVHSQRCARRGMDAQMWADPE